MTPDTIPRSLRAMGGKLALLLCPLMLTGCLATSPLATVESDKNRDGLWDSVEWDLLKSGIWDKYDARPVRLVAIHYQLKLRHPQYVDSVRWGAPSMYARATTCLTHLYGAEKATVARREINKSVSEAFFGPANAKLVSPRLTLRRQQHQLVDRHWQSFRMVPYDNPSEAEACSDDYKGTDFFDRY